MTVWEGVVHVLADAVAIIVAGVMPFAWAVTLVLVVLSLVPKNGDGAVNVFVAFILCGICTLREL
jgi:hypothetical protein